MLAMKKILLYMFGITALVAGCQKANFDMNATGEGLG